MGAYLPPSTKYFHAISVFLTRRPSRTKSHSEIKSLSLCLSFVLFYLGRYQGIHTLNANDSQSDMANFLSLSHTHPYSLPLYARFRHTHSLYHEQFISKHCRTINVFLSGPFSASFLHFCLLQCTGNTCSIKIPTDWIRTEDIWFHSATTRVH